MTFAEWKYQAEVIGTALGIATDKQMRRPVLVFVDRRIEGLVGFMGVVESGNFYVPIDCKMPDQRVKLINDVLNPIAAITTTVADDKILDLIEFKGVRFNYAEVIDNEIDKAYIADVRSKVIDTDPLYSIFTGGSTGIPKGVVISHRGAIDLAEWLVETFGFDETDALGNQTPFYFDGSVKDIYICLKSGATLNIIAKKYFTFTKLLVKFLNERKITTILWATSAVVLVGNSQILNDSVPKYIKRVFLQVKQCRQSN